MEVRFGLLAKFRTSTSKLGGRGLLYPEKKVNGQIIFFQLVKLEFLTSSTQ